MKKVQYLIGIITTIVCMAGATAQAAPDPKTGFGTPGVTKNTAVQIMELRVTYRFDQTGVHGKAPNTVPVQTVLRLRNNGETETVHLAIPLGHVPGDMSDITALRINGKSYPPGRPDVLSLINVPEPLQSSPISFVIPKNGEAIIDLRLNQPMQQLELPVRLHTAAGWNGTIKKATIEAVMPHETANWNIVLRKQTDNVLIPITYQEATAVWSAENVETTLENDVYFQIADPDAVDYFRQGNERWHETDGDIASYEMMRKALLDMVPCNENKMPPETWWSQTYETVTMGVVARTPQGQARSAKEAELWSAGWRLAEEPEAECVARMQNKARYRSAIGVLLQTAPEQRTAETIETLKTHDRFLKRLVKILGDNSLNTATDGTDLQNAKVTERDAQLLAEWDSRFASTTTKQTPDQKKSDVKQNFFYSTDKTQRFLFSMFIILILGTGSYFILKSETRPKRRDEVLDVIGEPTIPPPSAPNEPKKETTINLMNTSEETKQTQTDSSIRIEQKPPAKPPSFNEPSNTPISEIPWSSDLVNGHKTEQLIKPKTPLPKDKKPLDLPWQK